MVSFNTPVCWVRRLAPAVACGRENVNKSPNALSLGWFNLRVAATTLSSPRFYDVSSAMPPWKQPRGAIIRHNRWLQTVSKCWRTHTAHTTACKRNRLRLNTFLCDLARWRWAGQPPTWPAETLHYDSYHVLTPPPPPARGQALGATRRHVGRRLPPFATLGGQPGPARCTTELKLTMLLPTPHGRRAQPTTQAESHPHGRASRPHSVCHGPPWSPPTPMCDV